VVDVFEAIANVVATTYVDARFLGRAIDLPAALIITVEIGI
jgi:hypothetical protein